MSLASAVPASEIARSVMASARAAHRFDEPYRHYLVDSLMPETVAAALGELPMQAPALDGVSGRRELHNDQRSYADAHNMQRFPVLKHVAEALQSTEVARALHEAFDAPIDDTFLRLEYALDTDGFWLEPHTDLGVKKFTCLIYLSDGPGHATLGTDIYASKDQHFGRTPFVPNSAMIFIPSDRTWHGFEQRPISGVRKSLILNYVTHDWRAREQLSYPDAPVRL
jgi:hypothetical protein